MVVDTVRMRVDEYKRLVLLIRLLHRPRERSRGYFHTCRGRLNDVWVFHRDHLANQEDRFVCGFRGAAKEICGVFDARLREDLLYQLIVVVLGNVKAVPH